MNRFNMTLDLGGFKEGNIMAVLDHVVNVEKWNPDDVNDILVDNITLSDMPDDVFCNTQEETYNNLMNNYIIKLSSKIPNKEFETAQWVHYEHFMVDEKFVIRIAIINDLGVIDYKFEFVDGKMDFDVNDILVDNITLSDMPDDKKSLNNREKDVLLIEFFYGELFIFLPNLSEHIVLGKIQHIGYFIEVFGQNLWNEENYSTVHDQHGRIFFDNMLSEIISELKDLYILFKDLDDSDKLRYSSIS